MAHLRFFARGLAPFRSRDRARPARHSYIPSVERYESRVVPTASYTATAVVVHGDDVCATFTNTSTHGESVTVGIADYTVADISHPFATKQVLFDSATKTLHHPGDTVTLCIDLPPCPGGSQTDTFGSQVDTFAGGGVITTFPGNFPDYRAPGYLPTSHGTFIGCQQTCGGGDDGGDNGDDGEGGDDGGDDHGHHHNNGGDNGNSGGHH
jgi:hypothetical protein